MKCHLSSLANKVNKELHCVTASLSYGVTKIL